MYLYSFSKNQITCKLLVLLAGFLLSKILNKPVLKYKEISAQKAFLMTLNPTEYYKNPKHG